MRLATSGGAAKKRFLVEDRAKKKSKWVPSDNSLVCSPHFTEDGYKKTTKLRILLTSTIAAVFSNCSHYLRKENEAKRKQPRNTHTAKGAMTKSEGADDGPNVSEFHLLSDSDQPQAIPSEPSMTACF